MAEWRRWARLSAVLVSVVIIFFVVPVTFEVSTSAGVQLAVTLLMLAVLAAAVLSQVMRQLEDADRRIDGLLIAMMIAVLGFALGYYVLELRSPGQIEGLETRLDALYFTVSTLLTVGFGDVHATGQNARALVLVQMIFNVAVIATAATTITTRVRLRAAERVETRRTTGEPSGVRRRRQDRRTHRNPT